MSYLPGGDPDIPNQLPIPSVPSALDQPAPGSPPSGQPGLTPDQSRAAGRVFVRLAVVNGVILLAAVLLVYVLRVVDEDKGILVLVGAALVTTLNTWFQVRALNSRRVAADAAAAATGVSSPTVDRWGSAAASAYPGTYASTNPVTANPSDASAPFELSVEDVFRITGRGTVATGRVRSGAVTLGQSVVIVRDGAVVQHTSVGAIEMFRKVVDRAAEGDNVGLVLKGVASDAVVRGDLITTDPARRR